jgi:hypothetical protein
MVVMSETGWHLTGPLLARVQAGPFNLWRNLLSNGVAGDCDPGARGCPPLADLTHSVSFRASQRSGPGPPFRFHRYE